MIIPNLTAVDTASISAVGSVVVPPLVSLLKREKWSAQVKQLIAFAIAAIVTVAGLLIAGASFSTTNIASLVALIFTGSQVAYGAYFRGSAVETALSAVGSKAKTVASAPVSPPAA